ncbi:hypothetical protein XELAEV_18005544mg [Xenopus laevis]|uniref:Uncharacterized protein n=1 Tax=Xenopus laevis TaxID=8355 RepID=A0A974DXH5_XENLA|nr:hypothetical protein XELAEV_18005544mg [Xenopus laevis]
MESLPIFVSKSLHYKSLHTPYMLLIESLNNRVDLPVFLHSHPSLYRKGLKPVSKCPRKQPVSPSVLIFFLMVLFTLLLFYFKMLKGKKSKDINVLPLSASNVPRGPLKQI